MQHVDIADPYRHEPKGISTATAGQIYVADGSASGVWTSPIYGELVIQGNTTLNFTPIAADITQFKKLTNTGWTAGSYSGVVVNTNDITLTTAGTYEVSFWCNVVTSAADGTKYAIKYALDSTLSPHKLMFQKNSVGDDVLTASASGIVTATAGQVLSIHFASNVSFATFRVEDASLTVVKLK
jgi:hypothetical protein